MRKNFRERFQSGEKGQASILVGAMLLTFMLFFAFVVNTGMLVHAKINLQNAADMATYAGAATQARQLTQISYLNYEMRRQWKKFLFRYYVLGGFAQETHPRAPSGVRQWKPRLNSSGNYDFGVPTICVNFSPVENNCQNAVISKIPIAASQSSDAISAALNASLKKYEYMRQNGCKQIGFVNTLLRNLWLLNTDPLLETVVRNLEAQTTSQNAASMANATRAVRSMAAGLGIIPRLMLLRKRIDTLNQYVNLGPRKLDFAKANALKTQSGEPGPDWASLERPVQAYFSAFHTLGNHTFGDTENITLEELIPEGANQQSNLLALQDIKTSFGMYSIDMSVGGKCGENDANTTEDPANIQGKDCTQCLVPINFSDRTFQPIVGVAKDPSVMTYYAVKLSAKAKLLFSPFGGDLTLTAYSAAQPFGSRIGPPPDQVFFSQAARTNPLMKCFGLDCPERVPNLPIGENEPNEPTSSTGWNSNLPLFHYFRRLGAQGTGGNTGSVPADIGLRDMVRAYQVAMSPNPWESGKYNIPNDLTADEYVRTFSKRGIHAIWAPLVGPGASGPEAIRNEIQAMIASIKPIDATSKAAFDSQMAGALTTGMDTYITRYLTTGDGEGGEGINVVRIYDPFKTLEVDASGKIQTPSWIEGLPATLALDHNQSAKVLTSWSDVGDATLKARGRAGYSVKFVPLRDLQSGSAITTDGASPFTNRLPATGDVPRDLENLKH